MIPIYWNQACAELSSADPVMNKLIATYKGEALQCRGEAFHTLIRSIVGQQISVKAADSVWFKLLQHPTLFDTGRVFNPELPLQRADIAKLSNDELRACGLSGQKITYIREISAFFEAHGDSPNWEDDDDALIKQLTAIKGIGRWTAEMFMIFHLLKPNVLPLGDIGVLKAIYLHYNHGKKIEKPEILGLADAWKPWSTVATWHLWRSLDPVPVAY